MIIRENKNTVRKARHIRMRYRISGTPERPRLNIYRSLNNIYAQVIDDRAGHTLVAASTLDIELKPKLGGLTKKAAAKLVGETVAKKALEKGITRVVFDRGGYLYTGRIAEVAAGAREAGLEF
ncbi:MAG: 50S ribosomal protein L18 [Bacillota bacterium]|nr:50S ribosomal protein L18 [Bacillota bacterium]